jgi:hypothetical protein
MGAEQSQSVKTDPDRLNNNNYSFPVNKIITKPVTILSVENAAEQKRKAKALANAAIAATTARIAEINARIAAKRAAKEAAIASSARVSTSNVPKINTTSTEVLAPRPITPPKNENTTIHLKNKVPSVWNSVSVNSNEEPIPHIGGRHKSRRSKKSRKNTRKARK